MVGGDDGLGGRSARRRDRAGLKSPYPKAASSGLYTWDGLDSRLRGNDGLGGDVARGDATEDENGGGLWLERGCGRGRPRSQSGFPPRIGVRGRLCAGMTERERCKLFSEEVWTVTSLAR